MKTRTRSAEVLDFNRSKGSMNLLPGGYTFTHMVFWTVVALVAVGTNAVAIMLSIGAVILVLESLGKA